VDFEIPADLAAYLAELDEFIELQIRPLERHGDNVRFFDQWDLLLLLAPDTAAQAAARRPRVTGAAQPAPAPHGRPTASELLEAVREFLTGQVMPACTGQLAFHARVAANVLGIVAREVELGAIPSEAALADHVAAKLAVANPRYFDPPPPS
jgi:uncharacterized protein DUF6285